MHFVSLQVVYLKVLELQLSLFEAAIFYCLVSGFSLVEGS